MIKIRTIIIDDESLAREKIRTFLKRETDIEIVGECRNSTEALSSIIDLKPDLIFLDIKMPGMNAFEMLENLKVKKLPEIIFTTAFDKYAIKAFEVHAIDYILKPFDRERFINTLNRARVHLENKEIGNSNKRILEALNDLKEKKTDKSEHQNEKYTDRIVVKANGRIYFIKAIEIEWFEASGNYLKVFASGNSHLIRETLSNIEKKLDPEKFLRIQRSVIINLDFLKELKIWFHNEYLVYMKNGTKFTSGRSYKNNLDKIFKV